MLYDPPYGDNGDGWIQPAKLANLLAHTGEACIPEGRTSGYITTDGRLVP